MGTPHAPLGNVGILGNTAARHSLALQCYRVCILHDERIFSVVATKMVWHNKAIKRRQTMPAILPIRDLKNTAKISELCRVTHAPIFITKNGYGDMVIMSMKQYEETLAKLDVYAKLEVAETHIEQGKVVDAEASMKKLRAKYRV